MRDGYAQLVAEIDSVISIPTGGLAAAGLGSRQPTVSSVQLGSIDGHQSGGDQL